jgi:uncharacterized protein YllA (UPF0747 family)
VQKTVAVVNVRHLANPLVKQAAVSQTRNAKTQKLLKQLKNPNSKAEIPPQNGGVFTNSKFCLDKCLSFAMKIEFILSERGIL